MPKTDQAEEAATAGDVVRALFDGLDELTTPWREAFDRWQEEAQYRIDKEFGRALARHPDLYAELKRTYRHVRRSMDKAAREWGLR